MEGLIEQQDIENRIFTVRGVQVMIDSHLAELYGVETKYLNRAVRRNETRFPESFMFLMSKEEWELLRFQFGTLEKNTNILRSQNVTLKTEAILRTQFATSNINGQNSRLQIGTSKFRKRYF